MKLLLDEQLSAAIAEALRDRGHDVVAVQDAARQDWRGLDDARLFEVAQREGRAIVTDNVAHYRVLARQYLESGRSPCGVLYLNNKSLPRHCHGLFVSHVVERLDAVLQRYAEHEPASIEDFV